MCGSAAILSPRSLAHAASPPHRSICLALSPSTLAACPPSESTAASLCSSPACTVHAGFPVVPRCPSCWHHSQLMVQPSAPPLPLQFTWWPSAPQPAPFSPQPLMVLCSSPSPCSLPDGPQHLLLHPCSLPGSPPNFNFRTCSFLLLLPFHSAVYLVAPNGEFSRLWPKDVSIALLRCITVYLCLYILPGCGQRTCRLRCSGAAAICCRALSQTCMHVCVHAWPAITSAGWLQQSSME